MKQIKINGGNELTGTITISGAKNSAVALVPASLLADEISVIDNIPDISDIDSLREILEFLGVTISHEKGRMIVDNRGLVNKVIPEEKSKKLRASYYFMGALLGKYGKVEIYFPGGCSIGSRPINLHLKGFEALGAKITEDGNRYLIEAEQLRGNHIYLDTVSVGATINIMMAAVKAEGITIIENAAKEPEIVNVATFLNNMGAKITGAGTSEIRITGIAHLHGGFTEVIPDRIEAGTYIIAGALMGKDLKIKNIIPEHVESLLIKLKEIGVSYILNVDEIIISKATSFRGIDVKTLAYPGFPTDLQQPVTVLLTQCSGRSVLEETIYENRFQNIVYLNNMGARIVTKGNKIEIEGPTSLMGADVIATDLRAGACLILAGLIAKGTTTINEIEHILRGYEGIIEKLQDVGANIELIDE